jgi:hypothetical protein
VAPRVARLTPSGCGLRRGPPAVALWRAGRAVAAPFWSCGRRSARWRLGAAISPLPGLFWLKPRDRPAGLSGSRRGHPGRRPWGANSARHPTLFQTFDAWCPPMGPASLSVHPSGPRLAHARRIAGHILGCN